MNTQLIGRFALVSPVRNQYLAQVLLFKLAHRIIVTDTAGMHLRDQAVQFSSHVRLLLFS